MTKLIYSIKFFVILLIGLSSCESESDIQLKEAIQGHWQLTGTSYSSDGYSMKDELLDITQVTQFLIFKGDSLTIIEQPCFEVIRTTFEIINSELHFTIKGEKKNKQLRFQEMPEDNLDLFLTWYEDSTECEFKYLKIEKADLTNPFINNDIDTWYSCLNHYQWQLTNEFSIDSSYRTDEIIFGDSIASNPPNIIDFANRDKCSWTKGTFKYDGKYFGIPFYDGTKIGIIPIQFYTYGKISDTVYYYERK